MVAVLLHALSYSIVVYGAVFFIPANSAVFGLSSVTLFTSLAFAANLASFYYLKNSRNRILFYLFSHCAFVLLSSALAVILMNSYPTIPVLLVCWPFFFVNIIAYLLFLIMKRARAATATGVFVLAILMTWATIGRYSITMEKLDNLSRYGVEQRIYKYEGDYYFVDNRKAGVFKLTSGGSVDKIIDSDTRLPDHDTRIRKNAFEDPFCVRGNSLYYRAEGAWKKLNLDTNETDTGSGVQKEARCGFRNAPDMARLLGVKSLIEHSQISDDGYIYYSNETGLYRTPSGRGPAQLIVAGPVTVFSIEGGALTYYRRDKRKIGTENVRVTRTKSPPPVRTDATAKAGSSNRTGAARLHDEGLASYRKGQFAEAIRIWSQESGLDPKNANTVNNIAVAYSALGEHEKSIEYARRSLELDPGFGHAYFTLGRAYLILRDFGQAMNYLQKAVELGWEPGVSYYNLGNAYLGLNDYQNAEKSFVKAAELHYHPADSHYALGNTYQELNNHEKAIHAYGKVLEFNSAYPGAHLRIGRSHKAMGNYRQARKEFKKEMASDPNHSWAAENEIKELDESVWYLGLPGRALSLLRSVLWLVLPIAIPACFVYFMRRAAEFWRPTASKVAALAAFVFLFPFPMFILVVLGILPPFVWFLIVEAIIPAMTSGWSLLGLVIGAVVYLAMIFVCYLMVCTIFRVFNRKKNLMWGIAAALIVVSWLNVYICISAGGSKNEWTNSVNLYKAYFGKTAWEGFWNRDHRSHLTPPELPLTLIPARERARHDMDLTPLP